MGTYKYTQHGITHISINKKDVVLQIGETTELPDDDKQVIKLVKLKYLVKVEAPADATTIPAGNKEETK